MKHTRIRRRSATKRVSGQTGPLSESLSHAFVKSTRSPQQHLERRAHQKALLPPIRGTNHKTRPALLHFHLVKMARKAGGLAAIMSGQPVVVVKKRSVFWRLRHVSFGAFLLNF